METNFDVIVVGAGMAGLTAAAYLKKANKKVLLIEKGESLGGLVGAFNVDGFTLDRGARGIIDSGIVFPMLKQLGLKLQFVDNPIKMMVEDFDCQLQQKEDIETYRTMLKNLYPLHASEIDAIVSEIYKVMGYMDVLYGIENPLFLDKPYPIQYLKETLFPWMLKFLPNILKADKMMDPIESHLDHLTSSKELRHIIAQHFFEHTPSFFGLSYFTLYLQYHYPVGSTQSLVDAMIHFFDNDVQVLLNTEVLSIDPSLKEVRTKDHNFSFRELLWAADTKTLYNRIDTSYLNNKEIKILEKQKKLFNALKGADSVMTCYFLVDLEVEKFRDVFGPHAFYTPSKEGLSQVSLHQIKTQDGFIKDEKLLFDYIERLLSHTTYEISIPALRDETLAPKGKTALIVSFLMDYHLTKHFEKLGLYEKLKIFVEQKVYEEMIKKQNELQHRLIKTIMSSPITIERRTNAHEGSLSGYAFNNRPFPVQHRFLKVSKAVFTPFTSIKQAGQFTFNPAGVPVAILTGKLAADQIIKDLK